MTSLLPKPKGAHAELLEFTCVDGELVKGVRAGDKNDYSVLVTRHRKALVGFVTKVTKDMSMAEDIVQEALIKAYTKIHMFRGQATFKSWLYKIAINTAKNKLRSKHRELVSLDDLQMSYDPIAEDQMFLDSIKTYMAAHIESLPEKQKTALTLRVYEELSFKEIAEIMGCPYDTAKANYRHAVMKLKGVVEKSEHVSQWKDIDEARENGIVALV